MTNTDTDDERDRYDPWEGHDHTTANRTDAKAIRNQFGLAPFWKLEDSFSDAETPYPNCLVHEKPADEYDHEGGTNFLALGEKGSGKSTFGLEWATRLLDVNDETVIWRGSAERSEWLPLKEYTTVALPAGADHDVRWRSEDLTSGTTGEDADLAEVVRDVIRYDGLRDLLDQLEEHQFTVVYPDPLFRGCNEVMAASGYCPHGVEYVTRQAAREAPDGDLAPTPVVHWWVAFLVARLELGPYHWTSVIFDEAADLLPDSARADKSQAYEKVVAMRRVMADSRKYNLSLFFLAHHEENLHAKIRRTIQWRVAMPDGTANPCRANNDRPPVGFSQIPMRYDLLSNQPIGRGLFWTETNFTRFGWSDFPKAPADRGRWLQVKPQLAGAGGTMRARNGSCAAPGGAGDD